MSPNLRKFYCLSGCTAVGKTELALRWAEENDAEIVNCDSLLFYRGANVGTAKPTKAELARVPHHLIDICECAEQMDIGRFVDLAIETIGEIHLRGKEVLVTGGSGFYLKAFFEPVVDAVQVSDETKARVAEIMDAGLPKAVEELERRNPKGLGKLDTGNPRRIVKALERSIQTGMTLKELEEAFRGEVNALVEAKKQLTILERDKEELNQRIELRVDQMLAEGLVAEVESLRAAGFEKNPSVANAIGYREILAFLDGEWSLEQAKEKIVVNTRRLAKKQRTWFRGQLPDGARFVDVGSGVEVGELFAE